MTILKLVQEIGNEVCMECGPDRDCELEYEDCSRLDIAIRAVKAWNARAEPQIKADPQPCMYIGSTACTHPQENCGPWCVDYEKLPF